MSPRSGGRRVDSLTARGDDREIPIRLDKENGIFRAEVGGTKFEADNLIEIRAKILKYLGETSCLSWQDVIEIYTPGTFRDEDEMFGISYQRFWISTPVDGFLLKASADDLREKEDPLKRAHRAQRFYEWDTQRPFQPPCRSGREPGSGRIYIPYSPEAWDGLRLLSQEIGKMKKRFEEIIATPQGIARIQGLSTLLLPPGKEKT